MCSNLDRVAHNHQPGFATALVNYRAANRLYLHNTVH
jgi:hypothetical protein